MTELLAAVKFHVLLSSS